MPKAVLVVFLISVGAGPTAAMAQQSPYVGLTDRPIKALSADDQAKLRSGAGMGFALAAELNGYPGPKHVLELADILALNPAQADSVRAVFDRMEETAVRQGAELIAAEARLDTLFASGVAEPENLERAVNSAGAARARLRYTHLAAHLEMYAILSEHQRHRYGALRGYGDDGGGGGGGGGHQDEHGD
jgi:Spy/CpxP family protein refolding chaperone